jgi:ribonuclease/clavin/mitogillin
MIKRLSPKVIRILANNASPFIGTGTNCYLVGKGQNRILIDTGSPGDKSCLAFLNEVLKEEKCCVNKIIITHWHYDHIGGLQEIISNIL